MKVLMVTPSYKPIVGGTETTVSCLTEHLNKRGIQTDIMTFSMDQKWKAAKYDNITQDAGATVYRMAGYANPIIKRLNNHGIRLNLRPSLKFRHIASKYDILHFHDEVDLSFPLFFSFIKKPKVFHFQTLLSSTLPSYAGSKLNRLILKNCANVYTCTGNGTRKKVCELGVPEKDVKIVPNGVDPIKFAPGHRKESDLLLFHGRIQERKGLHILLKSLQHIKQKVNLAILGIIADKNYFKKIQGQIDTINRKSQHNVNYHGNVDQKELVEWYQRSSIFVCPSLNEDFGIVNIEAMSCQTPVIASNVGNIPDIIDDMKTGLLVPPGDETKLSEAIIFLLANDSSRLSFSYESRQKVLKSFSWETVSQEFLKVYNFIWDGESNKAEGLLQ